MLKNSKSKQINLLIIEDSEDDALLILRELNKSGYKLNYELVQTKDEMLDKLGSSNFDIVISDYNMPEFDGLTALRILRQYNYDMPFILVSGAVGEEVAVEAMKEGASDYIMKASLKRLVPAIEREINKFKELKSAEYEKQKSIELSLEAERKKVEALQFLEGASKMASIGIITSAITHEINQPLNAIKLGAEGILFWDKKNNSALPDKMINMLTKISDAANRIDEVIKHLRQLIINKNEIQYTKIELNGCVKSAISLITNKLSSQEISLEFENDSIDYYIKANQLQMELIINNLIQNASQSILSVENANKLIKLHTYKRENKIFLEVKDSGAGLPDVAVDNLFNPLFSTKKDIGGTGLGLAIVHRFLTNINASVTAYNNIDAGATFKIEFIEYDEGKQN